MQIPASDRESGAKHDSSLPASSLDVLRDLLEAISSTAPSPGGGTVACVNLGFSAALLAKVAGITAAGSEESHPTLTDILRETRGHRVRALQLAVDDGEAFADVVRALATPGEVPGRAEVLVRALRRACEPPTETISTGLALLQHAETLATIGKVSMLPDVAAAADCSAIAISISEANLTFNRSALSRRGAALGGTSTAGRKEAETRRASVRETIQGRDRLGRLR